MLAIRHDKKAESGLEIAQRRQKFDVLKIKITMKTKPEKAVAVINWELRYKSCYIQYIRGLVILDCNATYS